MARGLLSKETHETVVRFAPPLAIPQELLEWALDRSARCSPRWRRWRTPHEAKEDMAMKLTVEGIDDGKPIPEKFAFGVQDPESHVRLGENLNPAIRWSALPEGTKSLVLICVDTDVPTGPTTSTRKAAPCRPRCRAGASTTG
jgi:hypothetical protein